jgi:glycogen synthase
MKIALLSWETLHSIPVGGVAVHVTELAAALERKGHEVHNGTSVSTASTIIDVLFL